jgi:hypothetical protein
MNEYSDCAQKESNKAHGNQIGSLDLDVPSNGQCFIFTKYRMPIDESVYKVST